MSAWLQAHVSQHRAVSSSWHLPWAFQRASIHCWHGPSFAAQPAVMETSDEPQEADTESAGSKVCTGHAQEWPPNITMASCETAVDSKSCMCMPVFFQDLAGQRPGPAAMAQHPCGESGHRLQPSHGAACIRISGSHANIHAHTHLRPAHPESQVLVCRQPSSMQPAPHSPALKPAMTWPVCSKQHRSGWTGRRCMAGKPPCRTASTRPWLRHA